MLLIPQQPKTYSQIFHHRLRDRTKNGEEKLDEVANKFSQLMEGEDSDKPLDTPLAKQSLQPHPKYMICGYCRKSRHIQQKCQMAKGPCLICGYKDHSVNNCPFKRIYPTPPILPARAAPPVLSAPPLRSNPEPISRRVSFSPQQHDQSQRGAIAGRGQIYKLSAEEAEAPDEVMVGYGAQYLEWEPRRCHL